MSTERKRKRQRTTNAGTTVEYPEIPHVPMDVIPVLVNAIRVTTKFFAICTARVFVVGQKESTNEPNAGNSEVLGSIMDRVQTATEENTELQEWTQRQEQMMEAIHTWMNAVKRFQRTPSNKETATDTDQKQEPSQPSNDRVSVAHACFLYLWDLQQEHGRVAVRRAALHLAGHLLQKSRDCRFHLEQEDHLDLWMDCLVQKAGQQHKAPTKGLEQIPLWQQEAYQILRELEKGYGNLYPKLDVSRKRLRQLCPHISVMESDSLTSGATMFDWRRLRDIALAHGHQEIQQVERWIQRAQVCLDILVPRMGVETPTLATTSKEDNTDDQDDSEDEDIDWEDGEEQDYGDGAVFALANLEHVSAVDQTLAAMESAGGLKGGEMEIDFRKTDDDVAPTTSSNVQEEKNVALVKFKKCVSRLSRRHMPRLTLWLEGLTHADNLVSKSSTLVALPSEKAMARTRLVRELSELKHTVSTILASATRLKVEAAENGPSEGHSVARPAPRLNTTGLTNAPQGLRTTLDNHVKRRGRPQARSSRIQIKFRSG